MSDTQSSESYPQTEASPNVLIVDDDRGLADTYGVWLSDHCDVETAYGGVQARKEIDDDLDVVLLDRRMPGIPGDKVLEDIRDQGIDCQVAMLTAVEPDTDIIDLPFDEYIVKPVTQSDLRDAVDNLLLRSGFDLEAQEFFAQESKSSVLETRDEEDLRDPEAAQALQDDTEEARQSERIQDLKEQLQRLQRITSLIRDIDKDLVVATSREEIERKVCNRLAEADPYELAWIGDYTVSFDRATPRVAAGHDDLTLEDAIVTDGGSGPIAEAVSTERVQVVDLAEGDRSELLDPIDAGRPAAEFTAGAVVPLVHQDTVYGVLNIYADAEAVFDEREKAVLSELGDSIANGINSVKNKKLMLSDTVVELEFDVRDASDAFVALSTETGSLIELKGLVPAADGELTTYLEVTNTTTETFLEVATDLEGIETVRGIDNGADQGLYECRLSGPTVVHSLISSGANVESMRVEEGNGHVSAVVAPETDVRTVVESVQDQFDDTDLVAKRETERDLQSTEDFRQSLENNLTERQYSTLKAAFSAGYFDWPRGSTAKEIAESLDLAPPTLHEHLRGAQKEVIGAFFRETGEFDDQQRLTSDAE